MNLRKAVRVALAMKERNQKWLAEQAGFTPQGLSKKLNNESVNTRTLEQLAKALDMKMSELIALGEDE